MILFALVVSTAAAPISVGGDWRTLAPGVEYAALPVERVIPYGDGILHALRVDPAIARLVALAASQQGGGNRTAGAWCDKRGLVAAINAGMYETDFVTHTGYLRVGAHTNNETWVEQYKSMLALGARRSGLASAAIWDFEDVDIRNRQSDYEAVAQNLRLIRAPGRNVWKENGRRWSEAAIAQDDRGRILFLFSRSPFSMREFNELILRLPLGVVRAMHLEGGPEASLSVRGANMRRDLAGSYETGFNENDSNDHQWPLPNVIGIVAPKSAAQK